MAVGHTMASRERLVERMKDGDVEAFSVVFDEYHARLCRYLGSLVRDPALAEDLVQETFIKAYQAIERSGAPQNLTAWIYTIATNTALSALRRRRILSWLPIHGNEEIEAQASDVDLETLVGDRAVLAQVFGRLPRQDVACLLLHFQQGLSYTELAAVLGISIPAAKMRLSRARAAFRDTYTRVCPGGEP
ncbi:MAG: RNA polymerase sigma factor [Chloroflexi bacterium]|nr:RNA polymerase sigma factor [Chloroflexota bacterium]